MHSNRRPPITDAQRQMILDLLPVVASLRQIAAALDLDPVTARNAARPFVALMRATGTLGTCACGRERFHPYGCRAQPGRPSVFSPARRDALVAAIMTGDGYHDIARKMRVGRQTLRRVLATMTPDQRARRKALEMARRGSGTNCPSLPTKDTLYRRIADAVPPWLDHHLRDDVISETYIAVMEGTIADRDLGKHVQRFARVARDSFTSKWGHRSLDAKLFADGNATLADFIADPAALAAFDRIMEQGL